MKKILDVPVPSSAAAVKKLGKVRAKKASSGNRLRYNEMISSAVKALKKPKGSSRQAIAKYVQDNFNVPVSSVNRNVTKNLKEMVSKEQLLLTSGVGAAGRFKLNKAVASQTVKTETKKSRPKPRKPASPKSKKSPKKPKRKSPVKKKTAKRTTKKPAKPGKRTSKKPVKKTKK